MKPNVKRLDEGQLDLMWTFLKLQPERGCTKSDVQALKEYLDKIRQAMIQKTAGQRKDDDADSVDFDDLGTYINLVVVCALSLYIFGGLDELERVLPEREEKE